MNRYAQMMLMRSAVHPDRRDGEHREYDHPDMRGGYSVSESRFRDRDGREHYDNGRYAPMDRGSRGMSMGGAPMQWGGSDYPSSEYMEPYSAHPMSPYVQPMYGRPINRIGFSVDGEMERLPHYQHTSGHDGADEMSRHQSMGYNTAQYPRMMPVFNRQMADDWVSGMKNADGTQGPHFSMERVKEIMKEHHVEHDPVEFYAAINSVYSDFSEALKENNASNMKLYVCLAKAWIDDPDAVSNKAAAYYTYVVKH